MCNWKDFNHNGEVEAWEEIIADEMLCTSKEEHIALFGNSGKWDDDDFDDDFDDDGDDIFDFD